MNTNLMVEYAKYIQDPCYFIEKNFKVFDLTKGGFHDFKLFDFQKEAIHAFHGNRYVVTRKTRQAGLSTITQAYFAYLFAMATPDSPQKIYVLANKLRSAQKFFKGVREFLLQVPDWVWGEYIDPKKSKEGFIVGKGSTQKLEFINGSELHCYASHPDTLRSTSPTILLIDESAFVPNGAEMYKASAVATSTGGKIYLISTPNGMDELVYKIYTDSLNGDNNYKIVLAHWVFDPRYNYDLEWIEKDKDDKEVSRHKEENFNYEELKAKVIEGKYHPTSTWFRNMCIVLNNDERMINQELLAKFEGSGGNVIKSHTINWYESECANVQITKSGIENCEWMFKAPVEGHKYVAGVDVSGGDGSDFSALQIFDIDEMELAFEFRFKCTPQQLAEVIINWGSLYKALTVIDTTGGYADLLVHLLTEAKYEYLYYDEYEEDVKVYDKGREEQYRKPKKRAGFKIQKHRPAAISHYVSLLENKILIVRSIRTINEWKTYIWLNGRADHQSGFNDDCIMTGVMALWVAESVYNKIQKAKSVDVAIRKHFIGFGVRPEEIEEAVTGRRNQQKPLYLSERDPTGEHSWVYGGGWGKRR